MDGQTNSTRTVLVPLSCGTVKATVTVTGEVASRPAFNPALDRAFGLLISNVMGSLSSLGTKPGLRGEEHVNQTTVRFALDFGDNKYDFVFVVDTDMQGITKAEVAKLLAHEPCTATALVEFIDAQTKPVSDLLISGIGSTVLRRFFEFTPDGGTEKPVGLDLVGLLIDGFKPGRPGGLFG